MEETTMSVNGSRAINGVPTPTIGLQLTTKIILMCRRLHGPLGCSN